MSSAGFASPRTERGISSAYGRVPWHMRGRTLAVWYRLADPGEARRHVPAECTLVSDPIVRARFWDMAHDGGQHSPSSGTDGRDRADGWVAFREAVVAFPVTCGGVEGDFTTYMYSDDPVYTAFGREVMGWPVRDGLIDVTALTGSPAPGARIEGRLRRASRTIMKATLRLVAPLSSSPTRRPPPRWIGWKVIPDVDGRSISLDQIVETGPEWVEWGPVWSADAELTFTEGPGDELHYLRPREVVAAEYWSAVELTIGEGRVLVDRLRRQ